MEKITSTKSLLIMDVIESMDFEAIHEYMKSVNWTWALPHKDKLDVPSIDDLKMAAEQLLWDVKFNKDRDIPVYWLSTGGFTAYGDNKTYETWLEFDLNF